MLTHVVAKTLVFDEAGRVLLLVRSSDDEHRPGGPDIPGGKVEPAESYAEGACREALEESGLRLKTDAITLVFAKTKTGFQQRLDADVNIVWLGYVAKLPPDVQIVLSHEHSSFEWLPIEQAITRAAGTTLGECLAYLKTNNIAPELWQATS